MYVDILLGFYVGQNVLDHNCSSDPCKNKCWIRNMLPIVPGSPAPQIIEMGVPFDIWYSRSDIVLSTSCCNRRLCDSPKQFLLTIQFENWQKRAFVWAWWIALLKMGVERGWWDYNSAIFSLTNIIFAKKLTEITKVKIDSDMQLILSDGVSFRFSSSNLCFFLNRS